MSSLYFYPGSMQWLTGFSFPGYSSGMHPEWIAALAAVAVILVNLLTAAVIYGSLQQQVKNNSASITELKQDVSHEQDQQWKVINGHTEDISYLKGRQGVNGLAKGAGGHT